MQENPKPTALNRFKTRYRISKDDHYDLKRTIYGDNDNIKKIQLITETVLNNTYIAIEQSNSLINLVNIIVCDTLSITNKEEESEETKKTAEFIALILLKEKNYSNYLLQIDKLSLNGKKAFIKDFSFAFKKFIKENGTGSELLSLVLNILTPTQKHYFITPISKKELNSEQNKNEIATLITNECNTICTKHTLVDKYLESILKKENNSITIIENALCTGQTENINKELTYLKELADSKNVNNPNLTKYISDQERLLQIYPLYKNIIEIKTELDSYTIPLLELENKLFNIDTSQNLNNKITEINTSINEIKNGLQTIINKWKNCSDFVAQDIPLVEKTVKHINELINIHSTNIEKIEKNLTQELSPAIPTPENIFSQLSVEEKAAMGLLSSYMSPTG